MDDASEGESKWILEFIPKLIFLGIAITVIVVFTSLLIVNNVNTSNLEMEVFFNKLMYSSGGISYHDVDTGRIYMGVIDPSKLDHNYLIQSLPYEGKRFAAKITVYHQSVYYPNESSYLNLKPFTALDGPSGADTLDRKFTSAYVNENGQVVDNTPVEIEIMRSRT